MKTIKVNLELEIAVHEGKEDEAIELLDTMLENGHTQDPFNERGEEADLGDCPVCSGFGEKDEEECGACFGRGSIVAWHVTSAVVRRVG